MFKLSPHQPHSPIRSSQKFLTKHASSSCFLLFNCCRDFQTPDFEVDTHTPTLQQPKVSIRQLKKQRQSSFLQEEGHSRSKSKHTKTSNKTSIKTLKRKNQKENNHKAGLPDLQHEIFNNCANNQNAIPSKQKNAHQDLAVNNFNTTNYVVGQCLVQPQQNNFIFEDNMQTNPTIEDQLNSIFDSRTQNHLKPQRADQKKDKKKMDKKIVENNLKQQLRSYANFSFGQRQKQQIFSKYLNKITSNMKRSSNCLSQKSMAQQKKLFQMYEIDSTIQQQLNKLNDEEKNKFLRDTFQKKSLNYLVNKVGKTVFRSESDHSQSKESMVIETHKSIVEKFQNCKEIHLVS